jgi:hypothetical protein
MKKSIPKILLLIIACGVLAILIRSVIASGYNYIFDNDEFYHSQVVYLIAHGYKPFTDIYLTVYPPIFHTVLYPMYSITKFTVESLYAAREFLIVLFFVRVLLGAFIIGTVFGSVAGMLFIPLYLLSPFAIFVEMQIRPDNLMVTLFMAGLAASILAIKKKSQILWAISGALGVLSVLTLLKILPGVAVYFLVFTGFLLIKRRLRELRAFLFGGAILVGLFCLYFVIQGSFGAMIQQVFVESIASYSGVFEYPVPLGFFYHPRNPALFGVGGKPLTWQFTWFLPIMAFAGAYSILHDCIKKGKNDTFLPQKLTIIGTLAGQWVFLFYMESVFIQHYIPLNWLFAGLSSVCLSLFYQLIKDKRIYSYLFIISIIISLLLLVKTSIDANTFRSTQDSAQLLQTWNHIWQVIPENTPVFPNALFRPLAYPVPHGHFIGNIPDSIYYRLPSITKTLEKEKDAYVYIDDYYFSKLKPDVQQYILANYVRQNYEPALYLRRPTQP